MWPVKNRKWKGGHPFKDWPRRVNVASCLYPHWPELSFII